MSTGEKISFHRKKHNLTQEELAYKLNVSRQTIYKWEAGTAFPNVTHLRMLVDILSIDLNYLIKEDQEGRDR